MPQQFFYNKALYNEPSYEESSSQELSSKEFSSQEDSNQEESYTDERLVQSVFHSSSSALLRSVQVKFRFVILVLGDVV